MSIEKIVNDVLSETRKYFNLKTPNRHYDEPTQLELPDHKRLFYSPENRKQREIMLLKTRCKIKDERNPYEINRILHSTQGQDHIGNCGEYSCKALEYLVKKSHLIMHMYGRPFDITIIAIKWPDIKWPKNKFDHAFVMISSNYLNKFPDKNNLSDLFCKPHDSEIWICDPWANIACHSYEYPFEWKIKMTKWDDNGKLLRCFGDILKPKEPDVYNLIDEGIKSVWFNQEVHSGHFRVL
ncbi:hypothetical protein FE392_13305 [Xenorhabdus sp. 12]|uniref:Transglutaminase-like domain-containing protein n=1 Tax=Xenorhabdus santafensis TaxID=2582833 RepID=A0ABU4SBW9_9GAMM|nr:hypothetical protein [Xenorhabdus sp. 12]MDX7988298.1 hypothetical protein [Xenorhabdus sp. 12]